MSQEFRLVSDGDRSPDWVVGVYRAASRRGTRERKHGDHTSNRFPVSPRVSTTGWRATTGATSVAVFGQAAKDSVPHPRLTAGLRVERRAADYDDSAGSSESVSETMTGGEVSLTHEFSAAVTAYLSLARGYKAGGFNLGFVPEGRRVYAQEALWNAEGGVRTRWLDGRWRST